MTIENKLWRIPIQDFGKTWLIVAKTSEDALNVARKELLEKGYEEGEDYDFGYPEHWNLDEGNIIDPDYENKF